MLSSTPFPTGVPDRVARLLPEALQEALARPSDDPADAVLAAGRILRSGPLTSGTTRLVLRNWLAGEVDAATLEFAAEIAADDSAAALERLDAWRSAQADVQRIWTDRGLADVVHVDEVGRLQTAMAGMPEDPAWLWWMVALRDNVESVRVALRHANFGCDADDPRVIHTLQADLTVTHLDHWAEALADPMRAGLARVPMPTELNWLSMLWQVDQEAWWLRAARQAALMPTLTSIAAARAQQSTVPPVKRRSQFAPLVESARTWWDTLVAGLPVPQGTFAHAGGLHATTAKRLEWQAPGSDDPGWTAWALWPDALAADGKVQLYLEGLPPHARTVRWLGIERSIAHESDGETTAEFDIAELGQASREHPDMSIEVLLETP